MNPQRTNESNEPLEVDSEVGERTTVPVYEEKLNAGVQKVKIGGIRIHKTVEEHEEVIDQPLETEEVEVRRVVKNEVVSGPIANRQSGETLIIPVVKEVLKIERQWVLTEELHVTKRRTETRSQQPVTIRRENVEIERTDAVGRPTSSEPKIAERKAPRTTESVLGDCEPDRGHRVRKNRIIK